MREKYSNFNQSPFAGPGSLDARTPASLAVYHELMGIAKEIEKCRASL